MSSNRFITFCLTLLITAQQAAICQTGCEIIENSTLIRYEKGKLVKEQTIKLQVFSKEYDWVSDISLPFQKGDKLDILDAYILSRYGSKVRTLRNSDITTSSDISQGTFHSDMYKKSFSLHWGDYPYTIYYKYRTVRDKFIYLTEWTPYIYRNIPVNKARLQVEVPADFKTYSHSYGSFGTDTLENDNTIIYTWSADNLPFIPREYFAPPLAEIIPKVIVYPEKFYYSIEGELTSWQSFGQWLDEMIKDLDELTPDEKNRVHGIIAGASDKREIIRRLYHYMQDNTHYVNVSLKDGGLKPYPASYVCSNKYGDCKALTIYMKALLKEAGISSYFSVVFGGDYPEKIIREIPGPQFNHVILCIPDGKDTIWLENTNRFSPVDYLGSFTQDRPALVVNGVESRLVMTPPPDSVSMTDATRYDFDLDMNGRGTVSVIKKLTGSRFSDFIHIKNLLSEEKISDEIRDIIPFNVDRLNEWSFDERDRDDPYLTLRYTASITDHFRKLGNNIVISPPSDGLPQLESMETRLHPARIFSPVISIDTFAYDLKSLQNCRITLPDNISLTSAFGKYEVHFSQTGNNVSIVRHITFYMGEYDDEEYKALYEYLNRIRNSLKKAHIIIN